jgi:hypothetical protein
VQIGRGAATFAAPAYRAANCKVIELILKVKLYKFASSVAESWCDEIH